MLAEIGRRADFALTRATDVVHGRAHATVLHLRRIVGAVSVAVVRVKREAEDLVWDSAANPGTAVSFVQRAQHAVVDDAFRNLAQWHQLPVFIRPFSRHFAGVPGTGIYNVIQNGNAEYRIYRFTKD
jgi:hypothetical protein